MLFSPNSSSASSFYINIGLIKTGTPSDSTIKDLLSDGVFPPNFNATAESRILAIVSIDGATSPAIAFAFSHFKIESVKALSFSICLEISGFLRAFSRLEGSYFWALKLKPFSYNFFTILLARVAYINFISLSSSIPSSTFAIPDERVIIILFSINLSN